MMAPNHESTVQSFLSRANYRNQPGARRDIMSALTHYRGLVPKLEKFTFNDGRARDLICLRGTIPVPYRGNTYNIPVGFWILDTHPIHAPICYIIPTPDMQIKVSSNVDHTGKIYLPYLHEWNESTSDILGLIQVCIIIFGDQPPVFSRPPGHQPPPPVPAISRFGSTPYPSSTPYPPTSGVGYPSAYPPSPANYNSPAQPPYPPGGAAYPPAFPPAPDSTGTITQEHLKASLRSAVEDKVRRQLREEFTTKQVEMQSLAKIRDELSSGQEKLRFALETLDRESADLKTVCSQLSEEQNKLENTLRSLEAAGDQVRPEEAIGTTTPVYKQLVNAYAEEAAIEDAIYYLGEALRRGVVDCDTFLKQVRNLSRRQFFLKATMNKCREKAGLKV